MSSVSFGCTLRHSSDVVSSLLIYAADIDANNIVQERRGNNQSSIWNNGTIGGSNLKAYAADLVSLQVCSAGADASALRIWYASDSVTFEEYLWRDGGDEWVLQRKWENYSTAAGIGCHSKADDPNTYVALVNGDKSVEFWYKSTTDSSVGDTAGWLQSKHYPT